MTIKQWQLHSPDREAAALLAEQSGLPPFLALLLSARGLDADSAEAFLARDTLMDDAFAFAGMDAAVERIQRAIDTGESVAVFGDYDADGITATVLLYQYLKGRGAHVTYALPTRDGGGYGLHNETIDKLAEEGVRLLVTVDNGISAMEEAAHAAARGVDMVITDHHCPQGALPAAVAVIDPRRPDCGSVFKDYAGVGVAFKLVCALEGDEDAMLEQYADLVAVGTLADVCPLTGENRVLVRRGLQKLNEAPSPGLRALCAAAAGKTDTGGAGTGKPAEAGEADKPVSAIAEATMDKISKSGAAPGAAAKKPQTATSAVFTLTPRLNAAGRMGSPDTAAQLLLCEDEEEARTLANTIQELNALRHSKEVEILSQLIGQIEGDAAALAQRVLVLAGDEWHQGVLGILAARITERYGKPCILLSESGGVARGSGRSVPGFSLFDAVASCADMLTAYGGHELAAGLTLPAADIPAFRERLNAFAAEKYPLMPLPVIDIDCKLNPASLSLDKLALISALEPFGAGNPAPVFGLYGMRLDNISPVGEGKHLRLSFSREGVRIAAIKFGMTPEAFPGLCGQTFDLAVMLEKNEYRGETCLSVVVRDLHLSSVDQEAEAADCRLFDSVLRGEGTAGLVPTRGDIEAVYRTLRTYKGWHSTLAFLADRAGARELTAHLCLEILKEAGLISLRDTGDTLVVELLKTEGKADLDATPLMKRLRGMG